MVEIIEHNGQRILILAEIRGQLSLLNELAKVHSASIIIHTGNFGFFDEDSVNKIHESYLRHIAAFSPLLDDKVVNQVGELSKASGEHVDFGGDNDLKKVLNGCEISELKQFINGDKKLDVPVYTIYGMVEDSTVLNKFKLGVYRIPNLHILDEDNIFKIRLGGSSIMICGLGGTLSYHKLFHHGTFDNELNAGLEQKPNFLPIAGDPGNIWITMIQIGKLIETIEANYDENDVKMFVSHPCPSREGLLAHLSVAMKIDYTISNGLHFLYSSSFNELSVCPNFEYYKNKIIDSKTQLISIWKNVNKTVELIIKDDETLKRLIKKSLSLFDKIPYNKNNEISLSEYTPSSQEIREQNDAYYLAYQNMWHFNLCDVSVGLMKFIIDDGRFKVENESIGFDFKFRR